MRLSEAVRLGSLSLKPINGRLGRLSSDEGCALGMAHFAMGCTLTVDGTDDSQRDYQALIPLFPWIDHVSADCPCSCGRMKDHTDPIGLTTHLFDFHVAGGNRDWTIDGLCQWLDSIDPTPRESVVPSHVETAEEMLKTT